jgi:8-oxo-dGTP pyrophosphatase MutT (NUDIX family)
MKFEKSAGAIIFRRNRQGEINFLLLHYPSMSHRSKRDYWDFVKGHVEKGENEIATVRREAEEETGIRDLEFIPGFRAKMTYFFRHKSELILKTAVFYLAQTQTKTITLSGEHDDFIWLPRQKAREMLAFENAKKIFKTAGDFLVK